jgi:GNAT superfamily N-acetyltransferase
MEIQKLTDSFLAEFYDLAEKMIAESEFSYAKLDIPTLYNLIKLPNVVYFLAIENNKIIGFIGACAHTYFFSARKRISDLGFYVDPKYRGSRAALKLIKELEAWAKSLEIEDIHLGQTTATEIEKTRNFYERIGYKTVGFNTIKHLKE